MRAIAACIAVSVLTATSCAAPNDLVDGGMDAARPRDAGSERDSDADSGGGVAADAGYQCRFDPLADHRYVGGVGGVICQFSECPMWYQGMVDGGVAYGGCGPPWVPLDDVCIYACVPISDVATLPDGGQAPEEAGWAALCCGNGPACGCDEVCWAPNAIDAPHCIPR